MIEVEALSELKASLLALSSLVKSASCVMVDWKVMHLLNLNNSMLYRPCLLLANLKRHRLLSDLCSRSLNLIIILAEQFCNPTSLSVTIAQEFFLRIIHDRGSMPVESSINSAAFLRTLCHR